MLKIFLYLLLLGSFLNQYDAVSYTWLKVWFSNWSFVWVYLFILEEKVTAVRILELGSELQRWIYIFFSFVHRGPATDRGGVILTIWGSAGYCLRGGPVQKRGERGNFCIQQNWSWSQVCFRNLSWIKIYRFVAMDLLSAGVEYSWSNVLYVPLSSYVKYIRP